MKIVAQELMPESLPLHSLHGSRKPEKLGKPGKRPYFGQLGGIWKMFWKLNPLWKNIWIFQETQIFFISCYRKVCSLELVKYFFLKTSNTNELGKFVPLDEIYSVVIEVLI